MGLSPCCITKPFNPLRAGSLPEILNWVLVFMSSLNVLIVPFQSSLKTVRTSCLQATKRLIASALWFIYYYDLVACSFLFALLLIWLYMSNNKYTSKRGLFSKKKSVLLETPQQPLSKWDILWRLSGAPANAQLCFSSVWDYSIFWCSRTSAGARHTHRAGKCISQRCEKSQFWTVLVVNRCICFFPAACG